MLTLIPWFVLLHGLGQYPILGAKLLKYDMAENCGRTISMSDDDIYGIDVVMNMTSRMGTLGKCRLKLKARDDFLDYLHFYIADSSLPDCGAMSMSINEGDSLYKTVSHSVIPKVCGWKANALAGKDFRTTRRYLVLEFSWKLATPFTGTVFRLVANPYACAVSCASGFHRCNKGHCINSYLYNQPGYDFCGSSRICTVYKVHTIRQIHSKEKHDPEEASGGFSTAFIIIIGIVVAASLCIIWKCRKGRSRILSSSGDSCIECLTFIICLCLFACSWCSCRFCEGCREYVAKYLCNGHSPTLPGLDEAEYSDEEGYFERYAMVPDNGANTDQQSPPPSYTVIMETPDDSPVPMFDPSSFVSPMAQPGLVQPTSPRSLVPPSYNVATRGTVDLQGDTPIVPTTDLPTVRPNEPYIDPPSYNVATRGTVDLQGDTPIVPTTDLPTVTPNEPYIDPPSYNVATRGTVGMPGDTPIVPTTDPPPRYDVATTVHPQTDTPFGPTAQRPLSTTDEPPDYDVVMESRTSYDTYVGCRLI